MIYDINKLPDFYSVRNFEQIDYSFDNMDNKKCYCFFDNGFISNIIEPNKRDIRFIWDGFILFTDANIDLNDLQNGIDLYMARLVAFQRTNISGKKFNNNDVRNYILAKLKEKNISFEIMPDKNLVNGYPSKCDLWSTRDSSVLLDSIECTGDGNAYYFKNKEFRYKISFNQSAIPSLLYSHLGAIVLKGNDSIAIARLLYNDQNLLDYLDRIIGNQRLYSYLEGKQLSGLSIFTLKKSIKKMSLNKYGVCSTRGTGDESV